MSSRSFLQRVVVSLHSRTTGTHRRARAPAPLYPSVCWPFHPRLPPTAEAEGPTKPVSPVSANLGSRQHCLRLTAGSVPLIASVLLYELKIFSVSCGETSFTAVDSKSAVFLQPFFFTFLGCGRLSHLLGQRKSLEEQAVSAERGGAPPTSLSAFLPEHSPRPGEQE